MLILLPPSETKSRPAADAAPLDLARLALPELEDARRTMVRAAIRTAAGRDAATRLGVPASAPELVDRMASLEHEPAASPLAVYSGVLYDQLPPDTAVPTDRRVLVQSALLGVVDAATDRIPAYRLSAGSSVSRLGTAASWWAPRLRGVGAALLAEQATSPAPLVIDGRSGSYRSMMRLKSTPEVPVLEVAPVQERAGVRKVISHDAKRYRGIVTRELLSADRAPEDPRELVSLLQERLAAVPGVAGSPLTVELDGHRLVIVDRVA
ncbi:peroxide stress protein YaaA [Brachybacterium sp. J153]|uniref:peroxide stress protein YaaA n=1 Tax=Brachybacterium sp. J153 TaxID=3116488 RepID=UPI002E7929D8|nr:peroxide stress protein YaaA [Brachybacterium sp. J153]MEE1617341.1 peroxide stress protein YaaA [Brachybacterium sp. J153]